MNDALALLAVSQLVCIGGLAYLYMQVQSLRASGRHRRRPGATRVHHIEQSPAAPARATENAARQAYAAQAPAGPAGRADAAAIASRMSELGIDIPALARRMRKSEEEVRLLLRRQGAQR
ncbi:MAG: hypothetical protein HS107_13035 [Thermoflexaceae bacterium]|nr:hypothetical protein [Thermoflexaceae bacterium]